MVSIGWTKSIFYLESVVSLEQELLGIFCEHACVRKIFHTPVQAQWVVENDEASHAGLVGRGIITKSGTKRKAKVARKNK